MIKILFIRIDHLSDVNIHTVMGVCRHGIS